MLQTERTYETPNRVDYLRYAMGVNQHHDAVTGQWTAEQGVHGAPSARWGGSRGLRCRAVKGGEG